jgi:hypothetical protein
VLRAALTLLASFAVLACQQRGSAGEFEDSVGEDEGAPPDLPQPECDPRRYGDCPSGQKCSYVVDAELGPTNRCVDRHGEKLEYESCQRIGDSDDCAEHRICWATEADGTAGICVSFCDAQLGCEREQDVCSVAAEGALPLCLPGCDRSGATGAHGDACACLNCCDPGLACLSGAMVDAEGCGADGAVGCCGSICDLAQQSVCPSEAERCEAFHDDDAVMVGFEDVGICRL